MQVLEQFCHYYYVICKAELREVFAIDINAQSGSIKCLEDVRKCVLEHFRGDDISLSHASEQLDESRLVVL